MINIFFQEWAPLFPVLHRPTFLALYEQYVGSPDAMVDKKSITQLNLVFGIAALSSDVCLHSFPHTLKPADRRSHATAKMSTLSRLSGRVPLRAS